MERTFSQSIRHALTGLRIAFQRERNLRIHSIAGVLVMWAGWHWALSWQELALLVVMIAVVLFAECINTALEMLSDIQHPRLSSHIGALKDVSAGGVLVASIASVIVGLLIFLPHLQF